ncbi:uncharacterized protein K444DRAFT_642361 [Hyaloscypha bicolor E]|uniref:Uncharacterized protein n=1 Tax=Hyaloscypha bicolor E TaxID=1095630 RepID=A0A2J6TDU8_9HELO|nr:uncharacterized protein K444DRAFT_642361 [Hyaloscypha bicolor E]PMD61204.1 hypothetical protein K444DRAFT_642361 [Hyaloscypha bicolor E]
MALELFISPYIHNSHYYLHPLPPTRPLRIQIQGLIYRALYGKGGFKEANGIPAVRDEYLVWAIDYIDYYGVIFDYLVPANDPNPEVLAISINEVDNDKGAFANKVLLFQIGLVEYTGKKVLVVPRCCQVKKGTQDR